MESFLKQVAADLYSRKDGKLARTALVFPNKRAGLFFNEYLAQQSDKPLWAPSAISISELFRSLSKREVGDPVKLICELYKVFQSATLSKETLDDFYFWGELLLSDFDDADKNMVDTDKLFTNLQDLRALMDDYTFMDKEQEAAIQQFFRNFSIERRTALNICASPVGLRLPRQDGRIKIIRTTRLFTAYAALFAKATAQTD